MNWEHVFEEIEGVLVEGERERHDVFTFATAMELDDLDHNEKLLLSQALCLQEAVGNLLAAVGIVALGLQVLVEASSTKLQEVNGE